MRAAIWARITATGTLVFTLACSEGAPLAPSQLNADLRVPAAQTTVATTATQGVTLLSDLTASPSSITVAAGSRVLFTNTSGRSTRLHSYNCSEFSLMALPDGYSKNTSPFGAAGKTCDYFAWDTNWSRKIFVGQVVVR
jgi:hypothetical protein